MPRQRVPDRDDRFAETPSIEEVVRRAAAGEEDAWRLLVKSYDPYLRGVARSYRLGDAQTADVVATAWLRLVENIASLRDGTRVVAWLCTTVRRECLARCRNGRREQLVDDFAGTSEPWQEHDADGPLVDEENRQAMRRALAGLSERERRLVLLLFDDPSPSYRAVSTRLSIPLGSIGPTRGRILEKLRRILTDGEPALGLAG